KKLFSDCHIGTKIIVEEYIAQICRALRFVLEYEQNEDKDKDKDKDEDEGESENENVSPEHTIEEETEKWEKMRAIVRSDSYLGNRMDGSFPHLHYRPDDGSSKIGLLHKFYFYNETRHSLGRSALLLSGGTSLVLLLLLLISFYFI